MALKQEYWENYPNGTLFNTTNAGTYGTAGMTNISPGGGTMATLTSDSSDGNSCLQCDWPDSQVGQFAIPDTAAADAVCAFAFKLLAHPTTVTDQQYPVGARHASGQIGRLESNISSQLRASMTSVSAYGTALSLNNWYRIELQLIGAGTASTSLNYYVYTTATGMTLHDSGGVSGVNTTALGQIVQWRWGRLSAQTSALSYRVDTMRSNIGSSVLLGPPPTPGGVNQIGYRSIASQMAALQAASR